MFACLTGCSPCGKCFPLGTTKNKTHQFGLSISFRSRHFCMLLSSSLICLFRGSHSRPLRRIFSHLQRDIFKVVCLCVRVCFLAIFLSAQFINFTDQQQKQQQHQEICHAGRRIIKYFHLCRPAVYADADALCLWIDSWPNPKLAKPMHFK